MALLNYGVGHILKGFHNISIIRILERHNRVHCTNSFALQNPPDFENGEGARALELVAPSLVPRPGRPSAVPQPSSSSPGWCFLRGVRPRRSAVVPGSTAEGPFWPRWPTAHPRPTPAQRGDAAPRPVPCPPRAFARVVAARAAPPRGREARKQPAAPASGNYGVGIWTPKSHQIMALDGQKKWTS
jgi:hypothetical protein